MSTVGSAITAFRNRHGLGETTPATVQPIQIRNKFYQDLREFNAWQPWGERPDHTSRNEDYIKVKGVVPRPYDYPSRLRELIEFGWRAAAVPTAAKGHLGFLTGGHRSSEPIDLTQRGTPSALRRGLGRPVACDWDHITKFERVAAYSFRGETRRPDQICAAGGFYPPATRTDDRYIATIAQQFYKYMARKEGLQLDTAGQAYFCNKVQGYIQGLGEDGRLFSEYHMWRTILDNEAMHLRDMTVNSFLKGYISTSRSVGKARDGSTGALGGVGVQTVNFGWIYAVRVDSGFLLKQGVGGVVSDEAEIAHLGQLPWKKVYGFIGTHPDENTVYIRNMFDQQDYAAFKLVLGALSSMIW